MTVEYIYNNYDGEDEQAKIKNAIIDYQQNMGTVWVLLGGDETIVPIRYCYHIDTDEMPVIENMQICDLYYADITGDWDTDGDGVYGERNHDNPDLYPEVYLGRIPLRDSNNINNWIDKLITYETNPGNGDASYLFRVGYAIADQMRDWDSGYGQHRLVSEEFPGNFYQEFEVMEENPTGYDPAPTNPTVEDVEVELNDGYGITVIMNHGRSDGFVLRQSGYGDWPKIYMWSSGTTGDGHVHLNEINNIDKYGIVNSISCDFGAFDSLGDEGFWGSSLVEEFLKLEDRGAVAVIGYSRWGWIGSSYLLTEKFFYHLFNTEEAKHVGVAHVLAKTEFIYYRDQNMGLNLYGDPEMEIYRTVDDIPCFDSDGGIDYYVYGEGEGYDVGGNPVGFYDGCYKDWWNNAVDSCSGEGCYLAEKYCDGLTVRTELGINCRYGCSNGACNSAPSQSCEPYYDKRSKQWVYPADCAEADIT